MSTNISRAIELARKSAHAEATGQPRLKALYEKNLMQALQDARQEVRRERVKGKPWLAFKFLAEDVEETLIKPAYQALRAIRGDLPQQSLKRDFVLVGPWATGQVGAL
ncbi:hypothetical protein [Glutamicibacter sp. NPDC087344]|uniref:hypothetical protein n=1 Tax=Glutamicibacter sp. NPDC087344 TaxID=3363994 RepID=UPI003818A2BB